MVEQLRKWQLNISYSKSYPWTYSSSGTKWDELKVYSLVIDATIKESLRARDLILPDSSERLDTFYTEKLHDANFSQLPPVIAIWSKANVCGIVGDDPRSKKVWSLSKDEIMRLHDLFGNFWRRNNDGGNFAQTKLAYVLTQPCPTLPIKESSYDQVKAINDQIDKWNDDDYFCINHILSGMTDSFYDQYSKKSKTAKELWDTLKSVYRAEVASTKKFLVSNYMDFKMIDDRHVYVQVRELQLIANDICAAGMVLDENFHVGAIVTKFPPTWKEYRNKLKHKKEDLALDQLMQHLHIEEETRNREKEPAKETVVKAHVVVDMDEKKNS
ncbi:hypothetical protein RJ639_023815 [Escallonia herrerae]|uniref:Uncharacterized protein n=1 Tax=Escallonia herrerae TaxID=1293975 RepID=A0AA89AEV8_9ASTE|nr:hypothetical protein RJ639_023815 [Escallonia herrerae]